ncbi:MAG: glycosyltransferase family 39 protein [Anaerolineae bacterium]
MIIILAAYVLLAAAYSFATPPWEAPDEPSHYRYAEYLAGHSSLPPPTPPQQGHFWQHGYATSLYEWYQLPLYYALVAPQLAVMDLLKPESIPLTFPPINPDFPASAVNLFSVPSEHSLQSVFAPAGLRVARFFSILLGLATLVATYRLARLVSSGHDDSSGNEVTALTATGFMAFVPQFTFLSGYVTSDNLVNLVSALCLLAYIHLLERSRTPTMRRILGTGLIVSLALWTKLSLLFLLPLGLFCLLWRFEQHRSPRLWIVQSVGFTGAALGPFILGLIFLPGMKDQLAFAREILRPKPEYLSLQYVIDLWPLTNASFWGRFGWMNIATPTWITRTLTLLALIGLVGSLALLLRGKHRNAGHRWESLLLLWIVCGLVLVGFVQFNFSVRQPQGRLLFPALSAFVILVASGFSYLTGRYRGVVGSALVLIVFVINLISLFGSLLPAYTYPF